jgi:hypothetical protein
MQQSWNTASVRSCQIHALIATSGRRDRVDGRQFLLSMSILTREQRGGMFRSARSQWSNEMTQRLGRIRRYTKTLREKEMMEKAKAYAEPMLPTLYDFIMHKMLELASDGNVHAARLVFEEDHRSQERLKYTVVGRDGQTRRVEAREYGFSEGYRAAEEAMKKQSGEQSAHATDNGAPQAASAGGAAAKTNAGAQGGAEPVRAETHERMEGFIGED